MSKTTIPKVIGKPLISLVIVLVVATVVIAGGLMVTQQASLFDDGSNSTQVAIDQSFPGLKAEDLDSFITAQTAYDIARPRAIEWNPDAVFTKIMTPSQVLTWDGASGEWEAVFASPSAKRTLQIVVKKEGIERVYEGTGKDASDFQENYDDSLLDSPKILELVQKNEAVSDYIQNQLGKVNPKFTLMEKEELTDAAFLQAYPDVELFWKIELRPSNSTSKTRNVWVNARSGEVLLTEESSTEE